MKALSLIEPWASFLMLGLKKLETRNWPTRYAGVVAIHASRSKERIKPEYVADLCARAGLGVVFAPDHPWPLGKLVAVGELVSCVRTEKVEGLTPQERALGDYSPGRYAFGFRDVWRLPEPIPCKGALSLWEVPPEIEREITAQRAPAVAWQRGGCLLPLRPTNGTTHASEPRQESLPLPVDHARIVADAVAWAQECGFGGDIDADTPAKVEYPREGHGWLVRLREQSGGRTATACFTALGARAMWTLDFGRGL